MTRHRLAIAISSAVAACFLAVGLSAAGFTPLPRQDADTGPADPGTAAVGIDTASDTDNEPEVVYVKPAPKPKTVVVTQRARVSEAASSSTDQPRVRSTRGDDDDRYDERDDDDRHEDHEDQKDREDHDRDDDRERDDD